MRKLARLTLVMMLGLGLFLGGCATEQKQPAQEEMTAKGLVAEAKENICEVSVSEAKALLDKGGHVFLDCREPKEYKMGHVPGAINIPRGLVEFKVDKKIPDKSTNIAVYCKVGGRGCLTTCTLCRMGYKNVVNIDGGWMAWVKAGYPVE